MNTFWVTVQRTEAAERCELRGAYVLKAERDSLVLKDPRTNEILYVWPYRLLRRYGRDKVGSGGRMPRLSLAEGEGAAVPVQLCSEPCQMPQPLATTAGSPGHL